LSNNYHFDVGSILGPLSPQGVGTPGGRKINRVLAKYGFDPSAEKMDGDHVHEIQLGGKDAIENLWVLDSDINQESGRRLDQLEISLKSGKKPRLYQLREYVKNTNRQIYFKVNSTSADDMGNFLCIDCDPDEGGNVGQVILWASDPPYVEVIAHGSSNSQMISRMGSTNGMTKIILGLELKIQIAIKP
jgi:hypothetical protein